MALHYSPAEWAPFEFSGASDYPIQVDNLQQFQSLLDSFKRKLFLVLISTEAESNSRTIKISETKTYKIGRRVVKRTEKTITDPEELPLPIFNPDEYTIADLWAVLAKQGKFRKLRALLMGREIRGSVARTVMAKMSRKRKRPIINREDTKQWLTIRKVVFDQLTEHQKAEWGLLSGLIVVSKGGRLLGLAHNDKKEEVKTGERSVQAQLQGVPIISNRLATRSTIHIPTANPTGTTDEPLERPGNFPRMRPPTTFIDPSDALAVLEKRVSRLEEAREQAESSTSRNQLPKDLTKNTPECENWAGNHQAPREVCELDFEGLDPTSTDIESETEDSEDDLWYEDSSNEQSSSGKSDEWYEYGAEPGQPETKLHAEDNHSMLSKLSSSSDIRNECMSLVDWVSFAES